LSYTRIPTKDYHQSSPRNSGGTYWFATKLQAETGGKGEARRAISSIRCIDAAGHAFLLDRM
jgi:hypothetical protein